jgi:hypothetical protein
MMRSVFTDPPKKGTKFVALFGDGSGGNVFFKDDDGQLYDHEAQFLERGYLENAGYAYWLPLPDSFKLWFEISE